MLVEIPEGKRRCRWKDNIKMYFRHRLMNILVHLPVG
jgi:hypothetical protein